MQRTDGVAPPGVRTALVRTLVPYVGLAGWLFPSPVGFWVSFGIDAAIYAPILGAARRGLHDRAAGTIVVRVSRT